MLYNKRQFSKTNDKKVLHKVGKNWMAISLATLMAIGGFTAVKNVSAHAATNNDNTNASNTNTLKERLNASLEKTSSNQNQSQSNQQTAAKQNVQPQGSTQAIDNQANALHNRILANATRNVTNNGQGRIANQTSANNVLNQRITQNAAMPNVGKGDNGNSGGSVTTPVGANQQFDNVPVTVVYTNPNGSIQKHLNHVTGSISDNFEASTVALSGTSGAATTMSSMSDNGGLNSLSAPSGYSLANKPMSANLARGTWNWSGNNSYEVSMSASTSANLASTKSSGDNTKSYANWDATNNRPMVVYSATAPVSSMTVNFVNEAGVTVGHETVSGSNNAGYGDYVNVWANPSNSGFEYRELSSDGQPLYQSTAPGKTTTDPNSATKEGGQAVRALANASADYTINSNGAEGYTKGYYPLASSAYTITVPVAGKTTSDSASNATNVLHITINAKGHNGSTSTYTAQANMNSQAGFGQIGEYYDITPNDLQQGGPFANIKVSGNGPANHYQGSASSLLANYVPASGNDNLVSLTADGSNANQKPQAALYQKNAAGSFVSSNSISLNFNAASDYDSATAGINVYYVNQNGSYVNEAGSSFASSTIAGGISATANEYGSAINVNSGGHTRAASSNSSIPTPSGYTLDPNQEVSYKFNDDKNGQNVTLYVTGNRETVNAHIQPNVTGDSSATNLSNFTIPVSGRVGSDVTAYANKYISNLKSNNTKLNNDTITGNGSTLFTIGPNNSIYANKSAKANNDSNPAVFNYTATNSATQQQGKMYTNTVKYISYSDLHRGAGSGNNISDAIDWMTGTDKTTGKLLTGKYLTTVSSTGKNGQTFYDRYYKENVPQGYQLYKVLQGTNGHYGNPNNMKNGTNQTEVIEVIPNAQPITFRYYDQNGHLLKTYMANGLVNYGKYNPNTNTENTGETHKTNIHGTNILQSDDSTGTNLYSKESGDQYSTNYGQNIPASAITQNVAINDSGLGIPYGYHVAGSNVSDGSDESYSDASTNAVWENGVDYTRDPQNIKVMVVGDQLPNNNPDPNQHNHDSNIPGKSQSIANNTDHITIHELDPNGNQTNQYTINDVINGRVGDQFTINGHSYTPGTYHLVSSDNNAQAKSKYGPSDVQVTEKQSGITPNTADFYYQKNRDYNINNLQPINVYFRDGKHSIDTEQLVAQSGDYSDETVNVLDGNKLKTSDGSHMIINNSDLPDGYQIVKPQNLTTNLSSSVSPNVFVQVYNPATEDSGVITIKKTLQDYKNGQKSGTRTVYSDVAEHGKKGTTTQLLADTHNVPGYTETGDSDATVNFGNNDSVTVSGKHAADPNNNQQVDWNYDAEDSTGQGQKPNDPKKQGPVGPKTQTAQPIYVQYYVGASDNHPLHYDNTEHNWTEAAGSDDICVNGHMNEQISDISKGAMKAVDNSSTSDVPSNYHLLGHQRLNYTIGNQEQQVDLHIVPNTSNDATVPVTVHYVTNTDTKGTNPSDEHTSDMVLSDGGTASVSQNDYLSPSYVLASPANVNNNDDNQGYDENGTYNLINRSGNVYDYNTQDGEAKPVGNINYYFKTNPNNPQSQPIYVTYYNEFGQQVGNSDVEVTGNMGKQFTDTNLYSDTKGQAGISGYTGLAANQNNTYTISNRPQYADLYLTGGTDTNAKAKYNITAHLIGNTDSAGSGSIRSISDTPVNGVINGQIFTVKPSDPKITNNSNLNNYHVVPVSVDSDNKPDNVTTNWDGNTNDSPTYNPASGNIQYYYFKEPGKGIADPVMIQYQDVNSGKIVQRGMIAGQKENSVIPNVTKKFGLTAPGYSIDHTDPDQDYSYTFATNSNDGGHGLVNPVKTIKVIGDQVLSDDTSNYKFTVHIITKGLDGKISHTSKTINNIDDIPGGKLNNGKAANHYRFGQTIQVTASDFTPKYYSPEVTDQNDPESVKINNGSITPNQATFIYDRNKNNASGTITVNYINQNGQYVQSNGQLTNNNGADADNYQAPTQTTDNQLYGQPYDVTDPGEQDSDVNIKGFAIPTGYQLDAGQKTNYQFNSDNQNVTLLVHGDPVTPSDNNVNNNRLTVKVNEDYMDGVNGNRKQTDKTVTKYLNINSLNYPGLRVGDVVNIDPSQFTPNGFTVSPNKLDGTPSGDTDQTQKVQLDKASDGHGNYYDYIRVLNGNNTNNNDQSSKTVNFNYDKLDNPAGTLTLKYVNQAGNQVGYSDVITGQDGDSVNVINASDGGESVPTGYHRDPNQQINYTLNNNPQTVVLKLQGQRVTNNLRIQRVIQHSDGTITTDVVKPDRSITGNVGSDHAVDPTQYMPGGTPGSIDNVHSNYSVDYGRAGTQNVLLQPGNGTYALTPQDVNNGKRNNYYHTITFYYDDKTVNAAPITVRFVNQNNHQVGALTTLKGDLNDTIKVNQGKDVANSNDDPTNSGKLTPGSNNQGTSGDIMPVVPHGYHITAGNTMTFGNSPQVMNVQVQGNKIFNKSFTINVITEDSDGNGAKSTPVTVRIGSTSNTGRNAQNAVARVGDNFTISPYGFSDYKGTSHKTTEVTGLRGNIANDGNFNNNITNGNYIEPDGYHPTSSDSDVEESINSDGDLTPLTHTNFIYQRTYTQPKTGTIKINYITPDKNGSTHIHGHNYTAVDSETTQGIVNDSQHGITGSNFDLTPYVHDIPEQLSQQFYDIDTNPTDGVDTYSPVIDASGSHIDPNQYNSADNPATTGDNLKNQAFDMPTSEEPAYENAAGNGMTTNVTGEPVYDTADGGTTTDITQANLYVTNAGGTTTDITQAKGYKDGDKSDANKEAQDVTHVKHMMTVTGTKNYYVVVAKNNNPIIVD